MERKIRRERIKSLGKRAKSFWKMYKKNRLAYGGFILLLSLITIAIFAPVIAPFDYWDIEAERKNLPPCLAHLFGTDDLGRDLFSGVIMGTRISLTIGIIAAVISTLVGLFVGALGGYYGSYVDELLSGLTAIVLIIPGFFLVLVIIALFGSNIINVILLIAFITWPSSARLARAEFLSIKERPFVESARATGAYNLRIIFKHIMPNAVPSVLVNMSFQAAFAILFEAALSFIGLGDPNQISWGMMLYHAQFYIRTSWWQAVFPGLAIFITVLSFNLVGDGFTDALNPKLKER